MILDLEYPTGFLTLDVYAGQKRLNSHTRITSKGAFGLLPSSIISLNWDWSATRRLSALSTYSPGHRVAVGLGVFSERP